MGDPLENSEQIAYFAWARRHESEYPGLEWAYAIQNENSEGRIKGAIRKKMGVKKGVSDLCVPVPRGEFKGLYIELKRRNAGKVGPEQEKWRKYCLSVGYKAVICWGAKEAKEETIKYYEQGS